MWHFISEHITEKTDKLFICQHRAELKGGDSHQSFVIRDDAKRYFVKTAPLVSPPYLEQEADGLEALAKTQTVATPSVICRGVASHQGEQTEYLVLQHIKFIDGSPEQWHQLGENIARLHKLASLDSFGWQRDNYIGRTPQINTSLRDWATFYAEQRIGVMLDKLNAQGVTLGNTDDIVDRVLAKLKHHQPTPSLLHGDLWSGNVGFNHHRPYLYDPAIYVGDRETDLAMTELFGGFPEHFYNAYNQAFPLSEGYIQRKDIYQLYHILNHAVLFHAHYVNMAKSAIKGLYQ